MALRYWVSGGTGNTNSTTNWSTSSGGSSGASVPTSADDAIFNSSSGSGTVTVNAAFACLTLNFTGFTGTLAGSSNITVSGDATLGSGMTITYTGTLITTASSGATINLKSNGKTWNSNLSFSGSAGSPYTIVMVDDWTINGNLASITTTHTINNNNIYLSNNLTISAILNGTTKIIITGTSTISGTNNLSVNVDINSTGNISLNSTILSGMTFNYITASSFNSTGTLTALNNTVLKLGVNAKLNNLIINGTSNTYDSDIYVEGNMSTGASGGQLFVSSGNTYKVYVKGNLSTNIGAQISYLCFTGNTTITQNNPTVRTLTSNIEINGNVTISDLQLASTSSITYISGTFSHTGILYLNGSITLNTSVNCQFNTIQPGSVSSITSLTINSNALYSNNLTLSNINTTIDGTSGFVLNNLTFSISGTSKTLTLTQGNTYIINGLFTLIGISSSIRAQLTSSSGSLSTILNINGSENINWATATRIDSSGGNPVISTNTTKTQTINWGESAFLNFF